MLKKTAFAAVITATLLIVVLAGVTISDQITGYATAQQKPKLYIVSTPLNATVFINDKQIFTANGMPVKTPYSTPVLPGNYAVKLFKEGYNEKTTSIQMGVASKTVSLKLDRNYTMVIENKGKAAVQVYSNPKGAAVFIDYKFRGYTPFNGKGYAVGYHSVEIELRGYQKVERSYYFGDYIFPTNINLNLQGN